jgi:hypothetical protein
MFECRSFPLSRALSRRRLGAAHLTSPPPMTTPFDTALPDRSPLPPLAVTNAKTCLSLQVQVFSTFFALSKRLFFLHTYQSSRGRSRMLLRPTGTPALHSAASFSCSIPSGAHGSDFCCLLAICNSCFGIQLSSVCLFGLQIIGPGEDSRIPEFALVCRCASSMLSYRPSSRQL